MQASNHNPVWAKRLRRLVDESFDYLRTTSAYHRQKVVVAAVPREDGAYRRVYRYGVRGELIPSAFEEDLRDILGRARSVLDIAMSQTVKSLANPPLAPKQQRDTYFPIAATEHSWNSAAGKPHMKVLGASTRRALREIQPFVTGDQVLAWFQEIHNADKHDEPLKLQVVPDPEFVMMFSEIEPRGSEYWVDWVDPLPPIRNRVDFVSYRCVDPIRSAGIEEIPIGLVIWVDGDWRDVQHLLWDVIEFVTRSCAILSGASRAPANLMRNLFVAERDQLAAFKKMMMEPSRAGSRPDAAAEREWQRRVAITRAAAARFASWYGAAPPGH